MTLPYSLYYSNSSDVALQHPHKVGDSAKFAGGKDLSMSMGEKNRTQSE